MEKVLGEGWKKGKTKDVIEFAPFADLDSKQMHQKHEQDLVLAEQLQKEMDKKAREAAAKAEREAREAAQRKLNGERAQAAAKLQGPGKGGINPEIEKALETFSGMGGAAMGGKEARGHGPAPQPEGPSLG